MAYVSANLKLSEGGVINEWVYDTTDTLQAVFGAGYVTDAVAIPRSTTGKGLVAGDEVLVRRFTTVGTPSTFLGSTECVVLSTNATTGAATLGIMTGISPYTAAVTLAAGATNVLTLTIQLKDAAGNTLSNGPYRIQYYNSSVSTGATQSVVAYSGTLVAVTGSIVDTLTAKHSFSLLTDANGLFVGSLTDTAKTAGEYHVAVIPTGKIVVSAATVTGSYG